MNLYVIDQFNILSIIVLCYGLSVTFVLSHNCIGVGPMVETRSGRVEGIVQRGLTRNVYAFLGIPFAQPPLGDLRFRLPLAVKSWEGIYAAKKMSSACMQVRIEDEDGPWLPLKDKFSEDCLYLNIWTPFNITHSTNSSDLKPVLVWIYGGSFYTGSADIPYYDGRTLADYGDVVVVNFNYRLGVFGFLDADVPDAPGNQGLFDQALALTWIKENIEHFGGDPRSITLFGQSAGAVSVGLHLLSPISRNLFKRAIMLSGTPNILSFHLDTDAAIRLANRYAEDAGCLLENRTIKSHPEEVVSCLRGKYVTELVQVQERISQGFDTLFLPRYGDDFLPANPYVSLQLGHDGNVNDILVSTVANEGSSFLTSALPDLFPDDSPNTVNLTFDMTKTIIDQALSKLGIPNTDFIRDFLLRNANPNDSDQLREVLVNALGDVFFVCPSVYFSEMESDNGKNIYYYLMTYRPPSSKWADWMGVVHFDDVPFVFGAPLRLRHMNYTEEEIEFSKRMMDTVATFARTGNPPAQLNVTWPKYDTNRMEHMEKHAERARVLRDGPRKENCDMWRVVFNYALR